MLNLLTELHSHETVSNTQSIDSRQFKNYNVEKFPSEKTRVFNHTDSRATSTSIAARSMEVESVDNLVAQGIRKYINAINSDSKGGINDRCGYPRIANIIIELGEFIRNNDVSALDQVTITELNKLVSDFLNDTYFISRGQQCKLWAIHVDIIWLAHEMKKKNIDRRQFQLLSEKTQRIILNIGEERIENQIPMHDLVRHNFDAIDKLWKPSVAFTAAGKASEKSTATYKQQGQLLDELKGRLTVHNYEPKTDVQSDAKEHESKTEIEEPIDEVEVFNKQLNTFKLEIGAAKSELESTITRIEETSAELKEAYQEFEQKTKEALDKDQVELEAAKKEQSKIEIERILAEILERQKPIGKLEEEAKQIEQSNREAKDKARIEREAAEKEKEESKIEIEKIQAEILERNQTLGKIEEEARQVEQNNREAKEKTKIEREAAEKEKEESKIEIEKIQAQILERKREAKQIEKNNKKASDEARIEHEAAEKQKSELKAEIEKLNKESELLRAEYNQQLQTFNIQTNTEKSELEESTIKILSEKSALSSLQEKSNKLEANNSDLEKQEEEKSIVVEESTIQKQVISPDPNQDGQDRVLSEKNENIRPRATTTESVIRTEWDWDTLEANGKIGKSNRRIKSRSLERSASDSSQGTNREDRVLKERNENLPHQATTTGPVVQKGWEWPEGGLVSKGKINRKIESQDSETSASNPNQDTNRRERVLSANNENISPKATQTGSLVQPGWEWPEGGLVSKGKMNRKIESQDSETSASNPNQDTNRRERVLSANNENISPKATQTGSLVQPGWEWPSGESSGNKAKSNRRIESRGLETSASDSDQDTREESVLSNNNENLPPKAIETAPIVREGWDWNSIEAKGKGKSNRKIEGQEPLVREDWDWDSREAFGSKDKSNSESKVQIQKQVLSTNPNQDTNKEDSVLSENNQNLSPKANSTAPVVREGWDWDSREANGKDKSNRRIESQDSETSASNPNQGTNRRERVLSENNENIPPKKTATGPVVREDWNWNAKESFGSKGNSEPNSKIRKKVHQQHPNRDTYSQDGVLSENNENISSNAKTRPVRPHGTSQKKPFDQINLNLRS